MHYYDPNTGARVRKEGLVQDKEGRTFFINNDGSKYTGTRMIDGNLYYFEINSGVMQKGISIELEDGKTLPTSNKYGTPTNITRRYYFDSETGQLVKNKQLKNMINGTTTVMMEMLFVLKMGKPLLMDKSSISTQTAVKLKENLFLIMGSSVTMILILELVL